MHQIVSNSGIFEFLRIAFSLLVPLSLRYLIDYVERAELAEAAKRAAEAAEAASSSSLLLSLPSMSGTLPTPT